MKPISLDNLTTAHAERISPPGSKLALRKLDPTTYVLCDPISEAPLYGFTTIALTPFLNSNEREILDVQVVEVVTKYGAPSPKGMELRLKLTEGWTATLTALDNIFIALKSRQTAPDPSYFNTPSDAFKTPQIPPFTSMLLTGRLVDRIDLVAGDSSPEYLVRNLWREYQLVLEATFETATQMEIDGEHMKFAIKEYSNGLVLFDIAAPPNLNNK